ncbi:MAG: Fe-S cluster assembly protein SufD [Gemmatimonadetes bacterium]|nr:MAG: Fe-S cluster assembly protein SufD [Gemmatimonadota bacterium]
MAEGDPRARDGAIRRVGLPHHEAGGVAVHERRADRGNRVHARPRSTLATPGVRGGRARGSRRRPARGLCGRPVRGAALHSDQRPRWRPCGESRRRHVYLSTGHVGLEGPVVSHPRTLIVVDRGAQAAVVETYAALAGGVYWTNAVTEAVVGEGARLELFRVQREGPESFQVATTHSRQERDSYLALHVVAVGAALARHDVSTVLDGAGAELILNGLYLLSGAQHADHHTVIDHAQPHCASHEFFNGVLAERARGVFTGRIIVRPGAQRTDSKQTNNNLLLSTEARADSQPQLEIYADDVKCTHGSTVGPIDQNQLYYLRSRGLSPEAARSILTYGFGAEILDRMRHPDVRARLDRLVRERLGGG